MNWEEISAVVDAAWSAPELRSRPETLAAVERTLEGLDKGEIRVAAPPQDPEGEWIVRPWIKEAILLYFALRPAEPVDLEPFHYRDKIPLKKDPARFGIRVVPPAVIRYGSFLEPDVVVMPAYVNIGAWVGSGTMIDTWATVGSCAQVGRRVHISGGAGVGGMLEPLQASPVIVEDGAFLGSRCVLVEGVRIGQGAVLGAGVVLTASTPVVDVRGPRPMISRGRIPAQAVVIPGTMPKKFPAGEFAVPCALVIGTRTESTDEKTSLNEVLREFPLET